MCRNLKEWTFLLYANGNNELEPETWQSVVDIQNLPIGANIHVAVQVSRENQDNVSILRPQNSVTGDTQIWSGVRRYVFEDKVGSSFYNLTDINMADPTALYDFIDWGIANFPAKRYMLSISGHIYQFVGMCPDYSGDLPLMMGFPEMSISIQKAFTMHSAVLDILILDTCYASTVEILYELGRYDNSRIKRVLTYIGKGPLEGLPYNNLLSLLEQVAFMPANHVLDIFVSEINVNRQQYGLIALAIDHNQLELVRQLFDKLVTSYLLCNCTLGVDLTPEELLSNFREDYPWSYYLKPIHKLLKAMIIAVKLAQNSSDAILPIHILYQKIPDEQRKNLYGRLAFAKKNAWATLLCDRSFDYMGSTLTDEIVAIPITKNILTAFNYAGNQNFSEELQKEKIDEFIKRKHWIFL